MIENYLVPGHMLVTHLRMVANNFYDESHQPRPGQLAGLVYGDIESSVARFVDDKFGPDAFDWLSNLGITECASYRRGGSAEVLIGKTAHNKKCALRIPYKFKHGSHDRIDHEGVMQPLFGEMEYKEGTKIEALPLMPFVSFANANENDPSALSRSTLPVLHVLYQTAGIVTAGEGMWKDGLAVLPDGTPLLGDPDNCQFDPFINRLDVGVMAVMREKMNRFLSRDYPYLKPISWLENSQPKQKIFFGDGYLSKPFVPPVMATGSDTPNPPLAAT